MTTEPIFSHFAVALLGLLTLGSANESCELFDPAIEGVPSSFLQLSVDTAVIDEPNATDVKGETSSVPFDEFVAEDWYNRPERSGSSSSINPPGLLAAGCTVVCLLYVIVLTYRRSEEESKADGEDEIVNEAAPITWRAVNAVMIVTMMVLNYSTRCNLSVAILQMAKEFGYSSMTSGIIQSSFYVGHSICQPAVGILCSPESIGPKKCIIAGVAFWSAISILTPWAAGESVMILILARVLLGVGQAVAIVGAMTIIAAWSPKGQRATLSSCIGAGQCLGEAFALSASPITEINWPIMFYVFGGLGFVWIVFFQLLVTDTPATHPFISREEAQHIKACLDAEGAKYAVEGSKKRQTSSYWHLLCQQSFQVQMFADFCFGYSWLALLNWLPIFFETVYSVSTGTAGGLSLSAYYLGAAAVMVWGSGFDACIRRKYLSLADARRTAANIALLGSSVCFTVTISTMYVTPAIVQVLLLSTAVILLTANKSGTRANIIDLGGTEDTPRLCAMVTALQDVAGVGSSLIIGWLLEQPALNWISVFLIAVVLNAFAAGVYTSLMSVSRLPPEGFDEKVLYKIEG